MTISRLYSVEELYSDSSKWEGLSNRIRDTNRSVFLCNNDNIIATIDGCCISERDGELLLIGLNDCGHTYICNTIGNVKKQFSEYQIDSIYIGTYSDRYMKELTIRKKYANPNGSLNIDKMISKLIDLGDCD